MIAQPPLLINFKKSVMYKIQNAKGVPFDKYLALGCLGTRSHWALGRWVVGCWTLSCWALSHWALGRWALGRWAIGCWALGR
jgi:hypothetical protein